jgi:hypothetical protein
VSIAELRVQIQARKFRAMELAAEIERRLQEIRDLMSGYPLVKLKEIKLHLIAKISAEAARLQDEYLQVLKEIELGEKELEG